VGEKELCLRLQIRTRVETNVQTTVFVCVEREEEVVVVEALRRGRRRRRVESKILRGKPTMYRVSNG
jgi:hypothetical protein